jgi:hypothetical protein
MLASMKLNCAVMLIFASSAAGVWAQEEPRARQDQKALEMVRVAEQTELRAAKEDNTRWQFKDVDKKADGVTVSRVVETANGSINKKIEMNGRKLGSEELKQEDSRIASFVNDRAQQAKQRRESLQDDKRAESMLRMLPDAFLWSFAGDSGDTVTLGFVPNPEFHPPTMESRVFATMKGEIIVNKTQNRIRTIRGELTEDVKFGFGILGRMKKGGTFDVERRELMPGIWQITESHVHIEGKAMLFKSIGEEDDEVKSEFRRVPDAMTLEQAAGMLKGEATTLSAMR